MNTNSDTGTETRIERAVAEISTWPESQTGTTPLWKHALTATSSAGNTSNRSGNGRGNSRDSHRLARLSRPSALRALSAAAGVILLLTGAVIMLPSLGSARRSSPVPASRFTTESHLMMQAEPERARVQMDKRIAGEDGRIILGREVQLLDRTPSLDTPPPDVGSAARLVARNGSISVEVDEVGAAVSHVASLVSELHSEYVERSTLRGEGRNTQAEIVLRIASNRLDTVLGSIRAIGTVKSENIAADDVTAQAVDIEARLHNEKRVEIELLDLLDKRTDAPLREVLDLRDKLRDVRSEIERMQASRDRLSRLVALSTLRVEIRAKPEKPKKEPAESSFFKPLAEAVAASVRDGLSGLTGSIAWLVRVAVGGLLWWALIVGSILAWRRFGHVKHLPA